MEPTPPPTVPPQANREDVAAAAPILSAAGLGNYGAIPSAPSASSDRRGTIEDGTPARSPSSVSALPDLTDRLKEAGIYGEYHAYRQRYLQWRKGSAQGAVGELNARALQQTPDPYMFEFWYPSPSIFKWRFTIAYWKAILFLVGSLLFTFNSALEYWGGPGGYGMITRPNAIGAVFYSLGCYAGYLQLINIYTDKEERAIYLMPDFKEVRSRTNLDSVIGTLSYFIGALFFNVGAIAALREDRTEFFALALIDLPNLIGSMGFVAGGICEHTHNRIFQPGGATIAQPVWWVALCNLVGSVNFLLGSMPGLIAPHWRGKSQFVAFNFGMGAAFFIVSSVLMVVMWRANDFGLTLLKQLNFAIQAKAHISVAQGDRQSNQIGVRLHLPEDAPAPQLLEPRFSVRGTAFIVLYCWFLFVAIMNSLCKQQWYVHAEVRHIMRHILDIAMQLFTVLVITLVLVLHSAVTDVPDEQPFHCALITLRFVLLAGAGVQTFMFVAFFVDPHYDEP